MLYALLEIAGYFIIPILLILLFAPAAYDGTLRR